MGRKTPQRPCSRRIKCERGWQGGGGGAKCYLYGVFHFYCGANSAPRVSESPRALFSSKRGGSTSSGCPKGSRSGGGRARGEAPRGNPVAGSGCPPKEEERDHQDCKANENDCGGHAIRPRHLRVYWRHCGGVDAVHREVEDASEKGRHKGGAHNRCAAQREVDHEEGPHNVRGDRARGRHLRRGGGHPEAYEDDQLQTKDGGPQVKGGGAQPRLAKQEAAGEQSRR